MMEREFDVCAGAPDRSPAKDARWLGALRNGGVVEMYHQEEAAWTEAETPRSYFVVESGQAATI